jgi:hypothetical protein
MPNSTGTQIRTTADELFDLVKKSRKISTEEAAKQMKIPIANVQALVDFLVEEKIFGIEYKFTTPYIYLYKENINSPNSKSKKFTIGLITKEQFYEQAKHKKMPYEYIEGMWRKYLKQNITKIREEFLKKSKERKVPEEKTEDLWKRYLSYL